MFTIIITLLGGLAIFIYGIQCMGDGLQKLAGEKMKKILSVLTSTPVIGVAIGAFVTAIVQSSSLTTVMAVGFVQAQLLTLKQAISVIMGANIGTTITAQLVAFNITEYWALIVAVGFVVYFFVRQKTLKNTGYIFFALGLLLMGMVLMSEAMYPLRSSETFRSALLFFGENRVLCLLVGIAFTALVQSSSASIGLLIAMASSGLVQLDTAIPFLLGSNIGTCITALLASMGVEVEARRAAVAHVLFNMIGALLFLALLYPFEQLVLLISPVGDVARQIANAHTIFNVITTLLVLPFINPYTKLITMLVPNNDKHDTRVVKYLDWKLTGSPELAVGLARDELLRMASLARENLHLAIDGMLEKDSSKLLRARQQEEKVDILEKEICRYLATVAQKSMSEKISITHTGLLHAANDIERISDHADNIAEIGMGMVEQRLQYSEVAVDGVRCMAALADDIFCTAINALSNGNHDDTITICLEEQRVDDMERTLRNAHMQRLINGECGAETGVLFLDVISNLERVGDHANNIASIAQGKI